MKKLTNIHVVSRRQQQRPVMKFLKPVPFVVVLGIGLTLMGCGDGSDDGMARAQNTGTDFVAPTVFQLGRTSLRFRTQSSSTGSP